VTSSDKVRTSRLEQEAKLEELRRSREELETSRNKYAFLYDFAPVGYFTFDPQGVIRSVNLAGERLLGAARADLLGRGFEAFVAQEDRPMFGAYLQSVFAGRGKETCRLRLTGATLPPVSVRIEAMVSVAGDECLAVLVDITEKQRAEQALAESEYNLAKAQQMTHVGSWSIEPASGEVKASAELLRILRLQREEATREAFASVVHPEDLEKVMEQLRRGAEQGESYEIEHRLAFPDGTLRWVYTIVEPLVNSAGEVVRLYGTTQDITERKQAEVDLRNKTNELQAIFDSIGDGIIVYDHEGDIQHHNRVSPRFFPGTPLPGQPCRMLFHPEGPPQSQECPVERALGGERVDAALIYEDPKRGTRYLEVTATPIRDALGEKTRALLFFRDVSEKRMQEMHLIQTEKMSSIGVLATGIAHEINNPLTSVAGCAEALQRRFRDDAALRTDVRLDVFPDYLEVIVRESYRCKDIIDHLLSFGRKSDGSVDRVDINAVLREILELLHYQRCFREIEVVTRLREDLPRVCGDPSSLRQVFMNLLANAHQAIAGAGRVEVDTDRREGAMVAVVIRDNGCGMEQTILDRIWEPFFTTKDVGKGVGLGLALTYNIVQRHGGDIRVSSRAGEGSEFTVLLPVWQGEGGRCRPTGRKNPLS
jgi:PAS domain S-box-containing protein